MPRIKIDPEILRASSSKIASQISELNAYNGKLNGLLEDIHTKWQGDASNKYYNLMLNYSKKAKHMESVLAAFKKYSDTAVNKFESLDQECANRIRNSF